MIIDTVGIGQKFFEVFGTVLFFYCEVGGDDVCNSSS